MPNVGAAEILVVLVVALLVFGPQKLPEIGRQVGRAMRDLRRMQASLRDEVREVLEPVSPNTPAPALPPKTAGEDEGDDSRADDADGEVPSDGAGDGAGDGDAASGASDDASPPDVHGPGSNGEPGKRDGPSNNG